VGRATIAPRGGRTGGRASRGGGRTREPRGKGDGQTGEPNDQGFEANEGVDGVSDFSTIIAQQLQNLLPTILAQFGNQVYTRLIEKMESVQDMSGCGDDQKVKYTAGSFVDFKTLIREEFCPINEMQKLETEFWNHAMVGADHVAYTDRFHELTRLGPHLVTPENKRIERYIYGLALQIRGMVVATEPTVIQKAMQKAGILTDEAIKNGSLKKSPKKRGNSRETSRDRNVKDDNKKTRTGNAFATTTNPVRREYTGAAPKCANYILHHSPESPCRACFNCNRLGHLAKDCRVVPRMVNLVNARNLTAAQGACFECGGTDHFKAACPRLNQAQRPWGNRPNQTVANNGGQGHNQARRRALSWLISGVLPFCDSRLALLLFMSVAPTLGRGQGKGYMRKGGLEVNDPKKKKADVLRRTRSITVADNLLEDPNQTLDLAKSINIEENQKRDRERRSKVRHAPLVLEKEVTKEVEEGNTLGEGLCAVPNSPDHTDSSDNFIWDSTDDYKIKSDKDSDNGDYSDDSEKDSDAEYYNRFLNEPPEVQMANVMNEPVYTQTQTLIVVPLFDTILETQEDDLVDQVMKSPPTATTITPPTKSKKKQKLEEYEKNLNALSHINHAKAIEDSVQSNVINEAKNQLPKILLKIMRGRQRIEREKGASGSSSKEEKAPADTSNYERFKDADETRQEQEEVAQHDAFT
ncbi:reverse transcriptase domain-containing protein, partial [Tanacetum coccineum]